jgi:hypothetical protein
MTRFALLLVALFFVGCASSGYAPDGWSASDPTGFAPENPVLVATEPAERTPPATTLPEPVENEEAESDFPRHGLSVLMRYVTEERADGGWAIGLDYAYRFQESWAVGAFGEYLSGDFDVGVVGLMGYWYPIRQLGIAVGPGVEFNESGKERALARVGVFYEFEEKSFFIAPAIFADFLDDGEVALLLGGNIGMTF